MYTPLIYQDHTPYKVEFNQHHPGIEEYADSMELMGLPTDRNPIEGIIKHSHSKDVKKIVDLKGGLQNSLDKIMSIVRDIEFYLKAINHKKATNHLKKILIKEIKRDLFLLNAIRAMGDINIIKTKNKKGDSDLVVQAATALSGIKLFRGESSINKYVSCFIPEVKTVQEQEEKEKLLEKIY